MRVTPPTRRVVANTHVLLLARQVKKKATQSGYYSEDMDCDIRTTKQAHLPSCVLNPPFRQCKGLASLPFVIRKGLATERLAPPCHRKLFVCVGLALEPVPFHVPQKTAEIRQ